MPARDLVPITSGADLERACARLASAPFLAVDTEFHREKTYFAQLCLVQVGTPDDVILVDPLALRDLSPLRALLVDTPAVKVFHAARQDLEIFHDAWGAVPTPIFDTQLAASVLGLGHQVGYARLIEDLLGVHLPKAGTLTDWMRRPLAREQLEYAAADVLHLAQAYPELVRRLGEQGRQAWLEPELKVLTDPAQYRPDPTTAWRTVKGGGTLRGPARSALQPLAAWRDATARARNVPRRWVLADEALLEIARRHPDSLDALGRIRGITPRMLQEQGEQLLRLVGESEHVAVESGPRPRRISPEAEALADLLQCLLRLRARERGVAHAQLATRDQLERVAAEGEDADVPVLEDWRREMVGDDLLALRDGRLQLIVADGEVRVQKP